MLQWFLGLPIWAYIAVGVFSLSVAAYGGWTVRDWKCDAASSKALEQMIELEREQRKTVEAKATEFQKEERVADAKHNVRQEQIRKAYENQKFDLPEGCAPSDDLVRLLFDAVLSSNARASGEPSGDMLPPPSTPGTADRPLSDTVGGNAHNTVW